MSNVICVTGHRPKRLYGYNIYNDQWTALKNKFKKRLVEVGCTEAISGTALGVDTVFSLAVIELNKEGYNIKLHCAVPCLGQDSKWNDESKELYNNILLEADLVTLVTNTSYNPLVMPKRNRFMVDNSDSIFAVWDGVEKGGTYDCIKYARQQEKPIEYFEI